MQDVIRWNLMMLGLKWEARLAGVRRAQTGLDGAWLDTNELWGGGDRGGSKLHLLLKLSIEHLVPPHCPQDPFS